MTVSSSDSDDSKKIVSNLKNKKVQKAIEKKETPKKKV